VIPLAAREAGGSRPERLETALVIPDCLFRVTRLRGFLPPSHLPWDAPTSGVVSVDGGILRSRWRLDSSCRILKPQLMAVAVEAFAKSDLTCFLIMFFRRLGPRFPLRLCNRPVAGRPLRPKFILSAFCPLSRQVSLCVYSDSTNSRMAMTLTQAFQAAGQTNSASTARRQIHSTSKTRDRTGHRFAAMMWTRRRIGLRIFFRRGDYVFSNGRTQVHNGALQGHCDADRADGRQRNQCEDFDRFDCRPKSEQAI